MRRFIAKDCLRQKIGKLIRQSSRALLACYCGRCLWMKISLATDRKASNVSLERRRHWNRDSLPGQGKGSRLTGRKGPR